MIILFMVFLFSLPATEQPTVKDVLRDVETHNATCRPKIFLSATDKAKLLTNIREDYNESLKGIELMCFIGRKLGGAPIVAGDRIKFEPLGALKGLEYFYSPLVMVVKVPRAMGDEEVQDQFDVIAIFDPSLLKITKLSVNNGEHSDVLLDLEPVSPGFWTVSLSAGEKIGKNLHLRGAVPIGVTAFMCANGLPDILPSGLSVVDLADSTRKVGLEKGRLLAFRAVNKRSGKDASLMVEFLAEGASALITGKNLQDLLITGYFATSIIESERFVLKKL